MSLLACYILCYVVGFILNFIVLYQLEGNIKVKNLTFLIFISLFGPTFFIGCYLIELVLRIDGWWKENKDKVIMK